MSEAINQKVIGEIFIKRFTEVKTITDLLNLQNEFTANIELMNRLDVAYIAGMTEAKQKLIFKETLLSDLKDQIVSANNDKPSILLISIITQIDKILE